MRKMTRIAIAALLALCASNVAHAQIKKDVQNPFLVWTKAEAAEIKQRIDSDPLAKQQYDRMVAFELAPSKSKNRTNPTMMRLFQFAVMGDQKAGEAEKRELLKFIGQLPPGNKAGDPNSGNAQWRDDRTWDALRYDVLYETLTADERAKLNDTIRGYVDWLEKARGPWAKEGSPRTAWLPNMQWTTVTGVHVLAVASRDEQLIKRVFNANGGWKWYFDNYLTREGFYMEEFGKYYSNIGAMLFWCEGLEKLGLSQYGYGYTGKNGATMEKHLKSLINIGYPKLNSDSGMPDIMAVTMGDAGFTMIVNGAEGGDAAATPWWGGGRMNGPVRMLNALWYEMGHRRFPNAGYDYFLSAMRRPTDQLALPTLYFGLKSIDPKAVKAPPAPSIVSHDRGFALLRADESPAYWDSKKPAVGFQFGMYYVHYVHDCFALLQYVAQNRMIYNRMGATQGNYAGGDAWRDHVRGHGGGVVVDGLKAKFIDNGEEGVANHRIRHEFAPEFKFTAARAKGIYPDVEQERAMVLTDEYLFDAFFLWSDKPRVYDWHVMSPASLDPAEKGWATAVSLNNKIREQALDKPHLQAPQAKDVADKPWVVSLDQSSEKQKAGVLVRMLGDKDTVLVAGTPPGISGTGDNAGFKGAAASSRGVKLLASRTAPSTAFVALHEPHEGTPRIATYERIAQSNDAVVVRITGTRENGDKYVDIICLSATAEADKPVTLTTTGGEKITFTSHAFTRMVNGKTTTVGKVEMPAKISQW